MFCTKCGKEIPEGNAFCTNCGAPAAGSGAAAPSGAPAAKKSKAKQAPAAAAPAAAGAASPQDAPKKKLGLRIAVIVIAVIVVLGALVGVGFATGIIDLPSAQNDEPVQEHTKRQVTAPSNEEAANEEKAPANVSAENVVTHPDAAASSADATASTQGTSDYILPDSATRAYSASELSDLSDWELFVARNEIFARHGRGFSSPELVEYFSKQPWYTERYSPSEFDSMASPLNDIERENAQVIRSVEESRGSSYLQ